MPAYVVLYKLTQQGLANIKAMPERVKLTRSGAEKAGGRSIGVWLTMGEYDFVSIGEWPDDQALAAFNLSMAARWNVTTQTLKAFSEEEFAEIVEAKVIGDNLSFLVQIGAIQPPARLTT